MKIVKPCPECGHKVIEWRHGLTAGLVGILRRFWDCGGGPIHFSKVVGDDYSAASNLQKLRYFALLAKADQNKRTGEWLVTTHGRWFLTGKHKVARYAWTREGSLVRREAPFISIHDIERAGQYWVRPEEWEANRREVGKDLQLKLAV